MDLASENTADYDHEIERARSQLTEPELDKLKKSTYSQRMLFDQLSTVHNVLSIVLNYLYSGRPDEAWRALDATWPPAGEERVKKLILERRSRGLLSQAGEKSDAGL